jgi:hypothetical protein
MIATETSASEPADPAVPMHADMLTPQPWSRTSGRRSQLAKLPRARRELGWRLEPRQPPVAETHGPPQCSRRGPPDPHGRHRHGRQKPDRPSRGAVRDHRRPTAEQVRQQLQEVIGPRSPVLAADAHREVFGLGPPAANPHAELQTPSRVVLQAGDLPGRPAQRPQGRHENREAN